VPGLRPRLQGGACSAFLDPLVVFKGPTSKGVEERGNGGEGSTIGGEGERKGKEGNERGGENRGGGEGFSFLKVDSFETITGIEKHCTELIPPSLIKCQHSVHGRLQTGNQLTNATSQAAALSQAV